MTPPPSNRPVSGAKKAINPITVGDDMSAEPSTNSFLRRRGLLTAFLALAACDGDTTPIVKESGESLQLAPTNTPGAAPRQGATSASNRDPDYKLGPNDRLKITVFGQPTLTGEYSLDGNGVLSFPLIGNVPANGVTISQLQKTIAAKLEPDYLVNPNVSAEVVTRRPFFVIGEVQKPGNYSYVTSLTALNAVAMAGGFTRRARKNEFYVRRVAPDGQMVRIEANSASLLQPGDTLEVRERLF
jgi:polysaccharide export outer membrane protein